MKVLYFPLPSRSDDSLEAASAWIGALPQIEWEIPAKDDEWEAAIRAVWRGSPFVIAGRMQVLDRFLDSLDVDTVEVLNDFAYFWILTESSDYNHEHLPEDRMIALDWESPSQHIVSDALEKLDLFPRLKGLSKSTHILRRRIQEIAESATGPGCSVLILGPSGSGKEEVAQSLVAASARKQSGMQAVGGAWLNLEPGMAMSELVGLERGRREERIPGLLKQLSDKAMFIDDFESAPKNIQETMLRIMSVPEGSQAPYRPVGGTADQMTGVWPIFATNSDVESFARQDFLFRFGARIIWVLPLSERPADFAAIAQPIWSAIWKNPHDNRKEPLRADTIKHLFGKELNWDGNVRALGALLRLLAADMCNESMNGWSQIEIVDAITARGPRYLDWVAAYGRRIVSPPASPAREDRDSRLKSAAGIVKRAGLSEERELKRKLEEALQPKGVALLNDLAELLNSRTRPDGNKRNDPGRHLFYAALLHLAQKTSHEATSRDLKEALGIGKGQLQKLCSEMTVLFGGPLADLCICRGGDQTPFHFQMPKAILR